MRGIASAMRAWPDRRKILVYVSPEGEYLKGLQNIEQNASEANQAGVDMMPALMATVRELNGATIEQMMPADYTRLDVVFVFLAVLELLRIGQLQAELKSDDIFFTRKTNND